MTAAVSAAAPAAAGLPLSADAAPAFGEVYDELRGLAHRMLRRGASGDTLSTTALVHESYLRLGDRAAADRAHFFALAARAMRFIVVDHARARTAAKRGGGRAVTFGPAHDVADLRADAVLALDEALERLAAERPRLAQVVELRFFGGLTFEETAEAAGLSVRTAKRDWELARAWLHRAVYGP